MPIRIPPVVRLVLAVLFLQPSLSCIRADDGPYCGLYAVYGGAVAVGVKSDFESLIDPKYVSSRSGSTVADLVKAGKQIGVHATPLAGLGLASLQQAQDPLVLHMASLGQFRAYNHWILFLGMQDGRARTVDSGGKMFLMDVGELLARWDGVAIAISKAAMPSGNYGSIEMAALAQWALLALFTIGGTWKVASKLFQSPNRASQLATSVLVIASSVLVAALQLRPERSLLQNPNCVSLIAAAEGRKEYPQLTTEELVELKSANPNLAIFDTRYDGDMRWGHIPGAKALPVDLDQQQIEETVAGLDRNQTVVLYCQSKGCHFSDHIAVVLAGFGFQDVQVYPDGWVGWEEFHKQGETVVGESE